MMRYIQIIIFVLCCSKIVAQNSDPVEYFCDKIYDTHRKYFRKLDNSIRLTTNSLFVSSYLVRSRKIPYAQLNYFSNAATFSSIETYNNNDSTKTLGIYHTDSICIYYEYDRSRNKFDYKIHDISYVEYFVNKYSTAILITESKKIKPKKWKIVVKYIKP